MPHPDTRRRAAGANFCPSLIRHLEYTRDRLAQTSERLRERVRAETRDPDELLVAGPVDRISWRRPRHSTTGRRARERLGPLWATYWFRIRATVPAEWRGQRVELMWSSSSEATLWSRRPRGTGPQHRRRAASAPTRPDRRERGAGQRRAAGRARLQRHVRRHGSLRRARRLRARARSTRTRGVSTSTSRRCARSSVRDARRGLGAATCAKSSNRFCDERDPALLAALYENHNGTHAHELAAIGHAHIDTAWLWPLAETYRKCVRTFSSQLATWTTTRSTASRARRRSSTPGSRSATPTCGSASARRSTRAVRPRRRQLGRARLQPARRASRWSASSSTASAGSSASSAAAAASSGAPTPSATRGSCRRSCASAGITRFLTQKLSWNRFNRPEHHTFVWQGDRRQRGARALPPGRHVQQRGRPSASCEGVAATSTITSTRARACSCSATATAAAARRRTCSRRCAARRTCKGCRARAGDERASSSTARGRAGRAPRRRRRALLRVPPRRLHLAGGGEARQPPLRAGAARRRVPRGARAAARIRVPSSTGSGSCCSSSSSTTSSPARRSRSVYRDARRDLDEVEAAANALCGAGDDAREHDRRSPGARSSATATAVEARALRHRACRRRRRRGARRRPHARERAPARDARRGRQAPQPRRQGDGP